MQTSIVEAQGPTGPAIGPTITHRVRAFLRSQGVSLGPWSTLDETYGELYALLNRRRDDPDFWTPLSALLRQVIESSLGSTRLAAPQAELLSSWDADDLVRDLRAALPGGQPSRDLAAVKRFASGLSAAVLGGFLVLGLAASGCDNSDNPPANDAGDDAATDAGGDSDGDSDIDADGDGDGDGDGDVDADADVESWSQGCSLESSSVLYSAIGDSSMDPAAKRELCTCVSALNESWKGGLTELFETGTPQQIADTLDLLLQCCDANPSVFESSYEDMEQQFLEGLLCEVVVYKGVTFRR